LLFLWVRYYIRYLNMSLAWFHNNLRNERTNIAQTLEITNIRSKHYFYINSYCTQIFIFMVFKWKVEKLTMVVWVFCLITKKTNKRTVLRFQNCYSSNVKISCMVPYCCKSNTWSRHQGYSVPVQGMCQEHVSYQTQGFCSYEVMFFSS
jgi:hypothetical protein